MTRFIKYLGAENELDSVKKEIGSLIERDLSIEQLNALYQATPNPAVKQQQLAQPALLDPNDPENVEMTANFADLEDAPQGQVQVKKDPELGDDTVVLGINTPTKFVFRKINEDIAAEVEEEVIAPMPDEMKREEEPMAGYDFVPPMTPEELAAIVAAHLPNSKVIIAQSLNDGPHGEVIPSEMQHQQPILSPEEDLDGLSVAGMGNDLALRFM